MRLWPTHNLNCQPGFNLISWITHKLIDWPAHEPTHWSSCNSANSLIKQIWCFVHQSFGNNKTISSLTHKTLICPVHKHLLAIKQLCMSITYKHKHNNNMITVFAWKFAPTNCNKCTVGNPFLCIHALTLKIFIFLWPRPFCFLLLTHIQTILLSSTRSQMLSLLNVRSFTQILSAVSHINMFTLKFSLACKCF